MTLFFTGLVKKCAYMKTLLINKKKLKNQKQTNFLDNSEAISEKIIWSFEL